MAGWFNGGVWLGEIQSDLAEILTDICLALNERYDAVKFASPTWTTPDGQKADPVVADFIGAPLDELENLHTSMKSALDFLIAFSGSRSQGTFVKNSTLPHVSWASTAEVLTLGSYGSSFLSLTKQHQVDVWDQIKEAIEELQHVGYISNTFVTAAPNPGVPTPDVPVAHPERVSGQFEEYFKIGQARNVVIQDAWDDNIANQVSEDFPRFFDTAGYFSFQDTEKDASSPFTQRTIFYIVTPGTGVTMKYVFSHVFDSGVTITAGSFDILCEDQADLIPSIDCDINGTVYSSTSDTLHTQTPALSFWKLTGNTTFVMSNDAPADTWPATVQWALADLSNFPPDLPRARIDIAGVHPQAARIIVDGNSVFTFS